MGFMAMISMHPEPEKNTLDYEWELVRYNLLQMFVTSVEQKCFPYAETNVPDSDLDDEDGD